MQNKFFLKPLLPPNLDVKLMLVGHSLLRRGISGDSEIPFGPAMSIMALVMFLWGDLLKELYVSLLF